MWILKMAFRAILFTIVLVFAAVACVAFIGVR